MFKLSKNIKLISLAFMVLGLIGLVIGFTSNPSTIEEVKALEATHHGKHGQNHSTEASSHGNEHGAHSEVSHGAENHATTTSHDTHGSDAHYEHILHQYHNKPWAAIYVAAFFFFMIALGVLAFYAVQYAAQAGWSPLLLRVMEGITAYLLPGGIIMLVLLGLSAFNINHLFVWADPEVVKHDELIAGKSGWLNGFSFMIRAVIFLALWNGYRYLAVKFSRKQDEEPTGNIWYKKSFKAAAVFLVIFIYTESMMSWDWIMSFDPHWFSTLFGWYVFASMFVSGITVIALITIVLKSQGYLEKVNNSHIHDLASLCLVLVFSGLTYGFLSSC